MVSLYTIINILYVVICRHASQFYYYTRTNTRASIFLYVRKSSAVSYLKTKNT